MKVVIDRFEGDYAVVEVFNREMVDLPKKLLPDDAQEGDIIDISIDRTETVKRKAKIKELTKDLWK